MQPQFSHAASIFPVEDPLATAKFYQQKLGFDITFTWGEPPDYVVTNREHAVNIHFVKKQDDFRPSQQHVSQYIFVHEVDKLYQELVESGVEILRPVKTQEWGMREFDILDPNGFMLCFGTHVDHQ
jgi:predicted enzyme related to lactoylglutathione lyase